jgi:hypothetical protein
MAYEPPSNLQKHPHFHIFWDATKNDDINVFFNFNFHPNGL